MSFKIQLNHAGLETRVENKQQEHCKVSRFQGQSSRDCGRLVKTLGANRLGRVLQIPHSAISQHFNNEAFNISECYYDQLLLLFPNKMLFEQHAVWVLISLQTNESLTVFGWLWEACGDFH